jgi:hypothetical protein
MRLDGRYIAGAGAEQLQLRHARRHTQVVHLASPVSNTRTGRGRRRNLTADVESPQVWPERTVIRSAVETAATGVDAVPHLPGRPPMSSWDGEPGYGAPRIPS